MHLHIEGLFHPQQQYVPTAPVKLYWAPPQPGAGKRLKSMLGPFAETVDSFDNPISHPLIFNPFPGLPVQIEQHFTKVIPFASHFQGE
ncbi:MAG TPA: hypothetical protein ENI75_04230 [Mizugakiibacter sp.]|nr:hypothetical protein [Mizugakiibacter sp.]